MLYMVILYLLTEKIGFGLEMQLSYVIATVLTAVILVVFVHHVNKTKTALNSDSLLINDQKAIRELYPELISS